MNELTDSEKLGRTMKLIVLLLVVLPIVALSIFLEFRFESIEDSLEAYDEANAHVEASAFDDSKIEIDSLPWHPVSGQTLYVPAYSHIYHQEGKPRSLSVTLSVRNTDREHEIVLSTVKYFDTSGKEVRSMIQKPLKLGPLASTEFVIEQTDKANGSSASFIVHWQSGESVTQPVVETVMTDTSILQGNTFVRPATVLDENTHP